MANPPSLFEHLPGLERVPLIGIIRGYPPNSAVGAASVAHTCGVGVVEVTMDSPDVMEVVEEISRREPALSLGVGTVTRPEQVEQAAKAGARFVVTPALSSAVIEAGAGRGLPVIPGVATPSEILTALEAGVPAVKVFPAEQLGGPSYLRAVSAPLGHPPMVPTGGVSPENASDYLTAGAVALGAGSSMFPTHIGENGDWAALEELAGRWMAALG